MRRALQVVSDEPRPRHRGDCEVCRACQAWRDAGCPDVPLPCGHSHEQAVMRSRPCLYVGCHHSLYLDVHPKTGALKFNFGPIEPDQMVDSCTLDVVEQQAGETTLDVVGAALGITRERARQIEAYCLEVLRRSIGQNGFRQLSTEEPMPADELPLPKDKIPLPGDVPIRVPVQSRAEVRRRLLAARRTAQKAIRGHGANPGLVGLWRAHGARRLVLVRWCRAA